MVERRAEPVNIAQITLTAPRFFHHKTVYSKSFNSTLTNSAMHKNTIANQSNTLPRKKDDALLKAAFEELFPYLLRFCFPDADKVFDIRKGFVFLIRHLQSCFPNSKSRAETGL